MLGVYEGHSLCCLIVSREERYSTVRAGEVAIRGRGFLKKLDVGGKGETRLADHRPIWYYSALLDSKPAR